MGLRRPEDRRTSTTGQHEGSDESTPLLLERQTSHDFGVAETIVTEEVPPQDIKPSNEAENTDPARPARPKSVVFFILGCSFLTSLSFGITQVPMLYVFRLMTCDAYYSKHSSDIPPAGSSSILRFVLNLATAAEDDRCAIPPVEAATALSISLLGASTTVFGIANLFWTGSLIKRIGVKKTLLFQTFFPALRLLVQNVGLEVWGSLGIVIVQSSQVLTIVGGPSGYLLALNTFITEVVEHSGRTAALGRLNGSMMFGSAIGFLVGGIIAEHFGIKAPFRLTLIMFLVSTLYVFLFLPNIPPADSKVIDGVSASNQKRKGIIRRILTPLAVLATRKYVRQDGVVVREYGAFLLAWGVFLGILATGYLPTLLQLFATDLFQFRTQQNGWLIFMYSMLRGVFMAFAFPVLIAAGRRYLLRKAERTRRLESSVGTESDVSTENGLTRVTTETKNRAQFRFDLTYTRSSLLADGILTLLCSFVRQGWQMFLVAGILPFSAGTASAAKGTILEMIGSSAGSAERTDALAGISLVENMARLATTFIFGIVFAEFAKIGKVYLVFTCNAACALIGFIVLLFAHFPAEGSRPFKDEDEVADREA